ncbi:flavonoid 3'-monooxygenase-like [Solanum tuberosum]|uniref:flavonoid 3'-monooxygenase-like n=1 Tax=Solanum tuberosum TaxID=4113 RepID=UPI00073A3877|nr:PREDICTED: flavonoid 3'-monooxygenase-like [Solanum tuberosum]
MSLKFFKPLFDSSPWLLQQLNVEQKAVFFSFFLIFLALLWGFISNSNKGLPPGPKALPLIGNLHSLEPELHTYFASLSQTYGPICRLWFGKKVGIIITSPALAREVLKDKDTIFANRDVTAAGREFSYGVNDILWTPYGPKWRMLRKAGSPVNVGEQMFLTVLNVITSMLWGGTVKGEERASLGAEFRHVVTEIAALCSIPNLSDFYPGLAWFDFQGITKKMKVLAKRFDEIFESIIDQKQKLDRNGVGQESKDFLQVLLKLKDEADVKIPLTMTEIKALLMVCLSVVHSTKFAFSKKKSSSPQLSLHYY